MGATTGIEWTDATWNPVTGCDKVSPGCDHCYAETFAERWRGVPGHHFERGFDIVLRPERLDQPLRWTKPKRIFVNSMSDLFHDEIPDHFIAEVFAVMALAQHHTFQLLTKRHGRMRSLLNNPGFRDLVDTAMIGRGSHNETHDVGWPLPNVWLGVSVENQTWADIRVPALLETPAAVRFLSMEPLLGPVNLRDMDIDHRGMYQIDALTGRNTDMARPCRDVPSIDWIIVGGESGRGARPLQLDWARSLRDQCVRAGVPFHFKQWGEWVPRNIGVGHLEANEQFGEVVDDGKLTNLTWRRIYRRVGKKAAGRELDGRTWDDYPEVN